MSIVAPIYTGTLNGKPLRFFKSPLAGPHLVWHATEDLHACLALPRSLRRHFRQSVQQDYADAVKTVPTADGIVTIAPHWMAQGMIDSMVELGHAIPNLPNLYAKEATKAWHAMTGDLPPRASLDMMVAAFRNSNGIDTPGGAA